MHIKHYMNTMLATKDAYKMEWLGEKFVDLVYELKHTNSNWYKGIEFEMHKMAMGYSLGEHFARKWVCGMENADHTKGGHWSFEQTEAVKKQHNLTFDCWNFYAVMNMMYSDYYKANADVNYYLDLAKCWLNDEDNTDCKTLKYYIYVVTR